MAEVIHIVDPDGTPGVNCDYTSLNLWEAAQQRNLVTAGERETVKCRSSLGSADTITVMVNGWTTDVTHYIKIWTDPAENYRHDGKWNTSAYRITGTGDEILEIYEYVDIIGLQIDNTDNEYQFHSLYFKYGYGGSCLVDSCIIRQSNTNNGACIQIYGVDWNVDIVNTVLDGSTGNATNYGIRFYAGTVNVYNCTIYNMNIGIWRDGGTLVVTNCAVFNNVDDFSGTMTIDHCASDDGDGTNAVIPSDWSTVFVDYANGDFHLNPTDTDLIGAGTDDPGTGLYSDDIDGETRTAPWDIGADEYVASGGTIYDVSLSLSQVMSLADSGQATAEGAVNLTSAQGLSDGGQAAAAGALSLTHSQAVTIQADAVGEASLALAQSLAVTLAANIPGSEASLSLVQSLGLSAAATATAEGAFTLAYNLALQNVGGSVSEAVLSLAMRQGLTTDYIITIEAAVSLAQSFGLTSVSDAVAEGQITVAQSLAISTLAQAAAEAGITLGQVVSISLVGSTVIAGLVTPDGRKYTISVEVRTLDIDSEDRTFTIN